MGGVNGALQDPSIAPSFSDGHCCATQDDVADGGCEVACAVGSGFCASKTGGTNPINNRFLREFMIPSDASNCATDTNVDISSSGVATIKKHSFAGVLPNANAKNWHCKWKISATDALITSAWTEATPIADREAFGWL